MEEEIKNRRAYHFYGINEPISSSSVDQAIANIPRRNIIISVPKPKNLYNTDSKCCLIRSMKRCDAYYRNADYFIGGKDLKYHTNGKIYELFSYKSKYRIDDLYPDNVIEHQRSIFTRICEDDSWASKNGWNVRNAIDLANTTCKLPPSKVAMCNKNSLGLHEYRHVRDYSMRSWIGINSIGESMNSILINDPMSISKLISLESPDKEKTKITTNAKNRKKRSYKIDMMDRIYFKKKANSSIIFIIFLFLLKSILNIRRK